MLLLSRNVYNLLYIRFSSNFSIFDDRKIEWWLKKIFEILKTGTTFTVLSILGKNHS